MKEPDVDDALAPLTVLDCPVAVVAPLVAAGTDIVPLPARVGSEELLPVLEVDDAPVPRGAVTDAPNVADVEAEDGAVAEAEDKTAEVAADRQYCLAPYGRAHAIPIVAPAPLQTLEKALMAGCTLLPQPLLMACSTVVALPQTAERSAGFGWELRAY